MFTILQIWAFYTKANKLTHLNHRAWKTKKDPTLKKYKNIKLNQNKIILNNFFQRKLTTSPSILPFIL